MSKKLKDNIFTYGMIILVIAIGIAAGTYAYYQESVTGDINGTVLAWDCDSGTSVSTHTFTKLYPGSSGNIEFVITSSIDSSYSIRLYDYSNLASGNHPNLKFYKDSAHSSASIVSPSNSEPQFTGNISAGGTANVYVYYDWPYGTAAETYKSSKPSFKYEIICKQL